MAPRIKISPDQVRAVAQQFRAASQESEEMVLRLNTTIRALEPDWEGMTKEHFYHQFTEWKTRMTQFVGLLDEINRQLVAIAAKFEEADSRL